MPKSRKPRSTRPAGPSKRDLEAAVYAGMDAQRAAFEAKFGRPPGPDDPIFFDDDADDPTPIPEERMHAEVVNAMLQAELPRHLIYTYIRTKGMVVDEAAYKRLSKEDKAIWDSAVAEYKATEGDEIGSGFYLHSHDANKGTCRSGGWMTPIVGNGTPWYQIDGEEACEFAFTDTPMLRRITRLLIDADAWFMVVPGKFEGREFPSLLVQSESAALVERELQDLQDGYISRGPNNQEPTDAR